VRTPFLLSFAAVFLVAAAVLTAPPWAPAWAPVRTGAPTEAASPHEHAARRRSPAAAFSVPVGLDRVKERQHALAEQRRSGGVVGR
jgi:hypothetical protein